MTDQQYRVHACNNTEPHETHEFRGTYRKPSLPGVEITETFQCEGIERPVLTTDEVSDDPWIFDGSQATARERAQMLRAVARDPREDDALTIERGADLIDALLDAAASVPTREQIAEALYENQFRNGYHAEWDRLVDDARDFWLSQADVVLAMLNGADR